MSAYTASLGQTTTCFAAAKPATGRVVRKVGQTADRSYLLSVVNDDEDMSTDPDC